MAHTFYTVDKTETPIPFATDFTNAEFHGSGAGKGMTKLKSGKVVYNKPGASHQIDKALILAVQYIRNWTKTVWGGDGVPIRINSTYRTKQYNSDIGGAEGGMHPKKLACDFKFLGTNAKAASAKLNTDLRDNGPVLKALRQLGINACGLYGPAKSYPAGFVHIDTRLLDGSDTSAIKNGKNGSDPTLQYWTTADPLFEEEDNFTEEKEQNPSVQDSYGNSETQYDVVPWTNSGEYNGKLMSDLTEDDPSFVGYGIPTDDLLSFKHEGISNKKRLWMALDIQSRKLFGENDSGAYNPSKEYPIGRGATIYVPIKDVSTIPLESDSPVETTTTNQSSQTTQESNVVFTEYASNITITKGVEGKFYPKVLKYVSLDPGYVPAYKNRGLAAKDIYPRLRVYAWSRTLYLENRVPFVDITPCIQQMNISSTFDGSEFTLKLSPLIGRLNGKIDTSKENNQPLWQMSDFIDTRDGEVVKLGNINREIIFKDARVEGSTVLASEYVRNHQYYEKIFQQNDLFFIRFEQLESDKGNDLSVQDKVGKGWYDLIGLADYIDVTSVAGNTDVSINVFGRDLTKALLEDNSYFNPYSVGHSESIYGGDIGSNGRYLTGGFLDISAIINRSVKQSMEFIFHRISSIGYVPDEILEPFPNRTEVSVFRRQKRSDSDNKPVEVKSARGIWQLVKFWIDDNIQNLRLVDDSVSNPQGSVWELMKKVCQAPFVELFTETLGSSFYVIARKPPFEQKIISKIVNEIQTDTAGGADNTRIDGGYVGGPQDGVKTSAYLKYLECLEAKNIKVRRSYPRFGGSLSNQQWEELDKKKRLEALEKIQVSSDEEKKYLEKYGAVIVDDKVVDCNESLRSISDSTFPLIININEDDVLRDSFRMTQTAFAWYQVHDRGNFAGQSVSLGHVPAVYFDEYAQVFGNRKLEVTSNYSDYRFFETKRKDKYANLYADQASQLLSFLVETNIHLPFTREGSFVINGDRRIKKGNYIYYRPTREIFYVERVENSIAVTEMADRTTTVTVSRGMVIDYIDGVEEELWKKDGTTETKLVSYFNIVDIAKLRDGIYDIVNGGSADDKFDYKSDMLIDVDVMNFFLKRKQFKEYDI